MSITGLAETTDQIQKYWAAKYTARLRESLLLGGLVNKEYEGEIKRGGDTVRVSQIVDINGQLLTVGTDADSFAPETLSTIYVDIVANKRAVASLEFQDLVQLQSQIDTAKVQDTLMYAMAKQINDHLYSLVAPSTSEPDHEIGSVSDFSATQLGTCRVLAASAKWPSDNSWYALLGPQYYQDLLNSTTAASSDYGASDAPQINGRFGLRRMGFNIFEDNSRTADYALLFHPDFLHYVSQTEAKVEISSTHSQKRFGLVMSVDLVFGGKLGNQGASKHIRVVA